MRVTQAEGGACTEALGVRPGVRVSQAEMGACTEVLGGQTWGESVTDRGRHLDRGPGASDLG